MPERPVESLLDQRPVVLVDCQASILEAAVAMKDKAQNAVLAMRDKKAIGILTEADIVHRVIAQGKDVNTTRVEEVMTRNPVVVRAESPFSLALHLMHSEGIHHIPVVKAGRAIGMVCAADSLRLAPVAVTQEEERLDHFAEMLW